MSEELLGIGLSAASPLIDMGINSLTHRQQLNMQKDFNDQQIEGNKELARFGQTLAMKTWNETNYEAQMKHIKAAGLNPGLLYGTSGSGGSTTAGNAGSVTGGRAPNARENGMGLQLASQIKLLNAQAENLEADTANKKADTAAKGTLPDLNKSAEELNKANTGLKLQETSNAKLNSDIMQYEKTQERIKAEIATESKETALKAIKTSYEKLQYETDQAYDKKLVDDATVQELISQARLKSINMSMEALLMKSSIDKNTSDIILNKFRGDMIQAEIKDIYRQYELNKWSREQAESQISMKMRQILENENMNDFSKTKALMDEITGVLKSFIPHRVIRSNE